MIQRIDHPKLRASGAPFRHAVVDDRYAFLAGVVAADLPEGAGALGDVRAETRLVMAAICELLGTLGLGPEDIVRVDVHLVDLDEMAAMNEVYTGFFSGRALPARTCTESAKLYGGSRVEITCQARLRDAP